MGVGSLSYSFSLNAQYFSVFLTPVCFLNQATYLYHSGSKPMSIVWQLEKPIPAKYLRQVQQAMG